MDKKPLSSKWLTVGIILLFFGTAVIPSTAQNTEKQSSRGNWLYVGGSGPGNYTQIQDAIENASNGDTVYVFDESSPYHEQLKIHKSITLSGENRNTTVLAGLNATLLINITASNVCVSGFTIQQFVGYSLAVAISADSTQIVSNRFIGQPRPKPFIVFYGIIALSANNLTILDNEFSENVSAIKLRDSHSSVIKNNSITRGEYAVYLIDCYDTMIMDNRINNSYDNIVTSGGSRSIISNNTINLGKVTGDWWDSHYIWTSSATGIYVLQPKVMIMDNLINDCEAGIYSEFVDSCYAARNKITQCYYGLLNIGTLNCTFIDNVFRQNKVKQFSIHCLLNRYIHNYWGRPRILPKPLLDILIIPIGSGYYGSLLPIPILNFDFRPALLPKI
jgi:parallel beta-helix repeat protein